MNDGTREPGVRNVLRRRTLLRPGRVGDPNVLTGAATPNQLSSQVGRPSSAVATPQPLAPRPAVPASPGTLRPNMPARDDAPPRRRGLPSFSVLIFLAFAALTAFRLVGQLADEATSTPQPTTRPPVDTAAPGPITFGMFQNADCEIEDAGATFPEGTDVWWVATLSEFQAPDAAVTILYHHDGIRFDREDVPADPSFGKWDTLCSGGSVIESTKGRYQVEVWNEDLTRLLARGSYDVTAGP